MSPLSSFTRDGDVGTDSVTDTLTDGGQMTTIPCYLSIAGLTKSIYRTLRGSRKAKRNLHLCENNKIKAKQFRVYVIFKKREHKHDINMTFVTSKTLFLSCCCPVQHNNIYSGAVIDCGQ